MDSSEMSKLATYSDEIKTAIFNLVISLCQQQATVVDMDVSKELTAVWLEEIASSLRKTKKDPLEGIDI